MKPQKPTPNPLWYDLKPHIARPCRLLGIDPGSKRIGVAVCDPNWIIASPVAVIQRTKFAADIAAIAKYYNDYECTVLIMGYPLNMDGSEGARSQSVRDFCAHIMRDYAHLFHGTLQIALQDERLSTSAAESMLIDSADLSRAKRKAIIDKMAAREILQGALG
jgi:putative Holliday junction resolvase